MKNPYLNRVAIKDPAQFYGRRKEVARVLSRIGAPRPQSVAIVGERKIGKSSLLNYIYAPEVRRRVLDDNYLFVFIDLQQRRYNSAEEFLAEVVSKVSEVLPEASVDPKCSSFDEVRRALTRLQKCGYKLVLLLDEFDAITSNSAFGLEFFAFLRSAANNYDVAYITSSARDLHELCHTDQIADSPFFNIFTNLYLRAFSAEEAEQLISEPSAKAGLPLQPYSSHICELAGHFPFFLQIACGSFFDQLSEGMMDLKKIEESFLDEAQVHFRYMWQHLREEERSLIKQFLSGYGIAKTREHVFEKLRRNGYFIASNGQTRLFSRVFAQVVAEEDYIPPTDPVLDRTKLEQRRRGFSARDDSSGEQLPQQLGRFLLTRRLGRGGIGVVYSATDLELGREVAIKLLRHCYLQDGLTRRRFLREARAASMISHPSVCAIYEVGQADGMPYIAMEFVKGVTLSERLRKTGPLPFREIIDLGVQVAEALSKAHLVGVVHRDIKPSNILIDEQGRAKVLDFGLAKQLLEREEEDLTEPGVLLGTVSYMSPEQAQGLDNLDARSDIFSLGVVLYEITTGKLPFGAETYFQTMEAIIKLPHVPVEKLRKNVPTSLVRVIDRALEKLPENRFQTAAELAAELTAVGAEVTDA